MKRVSMQELKSNLSELVDAAAGGEQIWITRHRRLVARLAPAEPPQVHRGARFGKASLRSALKRGTGGRSLAILEEDRRDSRDDVR
jgi:prevent-host-death family protein